MPAKKRRRRPASPLQRCYRAWFRHEGRIIRLLCYSDYSNYGSPGGQPRDFFKRITHRRWPKGWHMKGIEWSWQLTAIYASLPADQWVEVTFQDRKAA